MHVTLTPLLGAADFTDAQAALAVKYHLESSHIAPIADNIIYKMIAHYRQYKADGMSDTWILNEMQAKKMAIGGGTATPGGVFPILTDYQIVGFVSAMKRISKGDMPIDPNERPSWQEAYDAGLGRLTGPWDSMPTLAQIALVAGAAAGVVYLVPGMFGRYKRARG